MIGMISVSNSGQIPRLGRARVGGKKLMAMRALAFLIVAVALGGCVQDVATGTLDPAGEAGWK